MLNLSIYQEWCYGNNKPNTYSFATSFLNIGNVIGSEQARFPNHLNKQFMEQDYH